MIISYQWLSDYLPQALPVEELSQILTAIGLEVEAVEKHESVKGGLEGLVIGKVLSCIPHPNADKLKVTTVTIGGSEIYQIVCGAPNVAAGQHVVVAPVGAMVHPLHTDAFEIKKAKIRGESSEGMLCAEDEIGLGESHAGILVLPEDAIPGTLAKVYFNLPEADYAIHIGLTPNRSDAASHIGVARDVCAYLSYHKQQSSLRFPDLIEAPARPACPIDVQIESPQACPRYMGICLEGVKVGPSPDWMRQRLATIGLRSINNVVDTTNYVLHELGQPLHAFDADTISGNKITVRFAKAYEKFITLDGKERQLRSEDLMICDDSGSVAMAGVFGGLHSGVNDTTTRIFIESAYFDPTTIRKTSMAHGLRTDAATHFEKGVNIEYLESAMLRAAMLMKEVAGGAISSAAIDNYPRKLQKPVFRVRYDFIQRLSGINYNREQVHKILESLGMKLNASAEDFEVIVPFSFQDVLQPADIVEEILRIDGLDKVAIPDRLNIALIPVKPSDRRLKEKTATDLVGMGFSEIITNSITNSKYYPGKIDLVHMLNSLSSELDVMRPSMLETGLEVISYNLARRNMDLLFFEHGNTYSMANGAYNQQAVLALYSTGNAVPSGLKNPAIKADAYFLKSVLDNLVRNAGIKNAAWNFEDELVQLRYKNQVLASISEVVTKVLQSFDIKEKVYYLEINWSLWLEAMQSASIRYSEVPRFPVVQRDLALVLDKSITYAQLRKTTDKLKLSELKSYSLFDIFESEKLGSDKKSLALSYTFQLTDRTLTDAETEALMNQLSKAYAKDFNAQIRG